MKILLLFLNVTVSILLLLSVLITFFSISMIFDGRDNAVPVLMFMLLVDILLISLFIVLRKRIQHFKKNEIEILVFKVAYENAGLITAIELAKDSDFTLEKSKQVLEEMHCHGICEKSTTDKNIHVYKFSEVLTSEEKKTAKPVSLDPNIKHFS